MVKPFKAKVSNFPLLENEKLFSALLFEKK
jgi:hypothetical protein